ncbi:hypothetical protein JTL56_32905, partial [Pseudomonas aeruginosa]|nr:hypothetical protein [Pseudomonas aeruginosa]
LLVLSDRNIAKDRLPVPAPMAVGAIQTRLVDKSLRCDANIIVETASARDPHHFAVLLGFGATAIYPYLAYETLAKLVGPMITYLLPLLIGYTGGKLVGGERGGVVGAITTMGVIVGADMPMFLGSMIAGPLGGYCIKKFDNWV